MIPPSLPLAIATAVISMISWTVCAIAAWVQWHDGEWEAAAILGLVAILNAIACLWSALVLAAVAHA